MGSGRKPCRNISQLKTAIVGSLRSWAQMCLLFSLCPGAELWKSTGVDFIHYFTKCLGLVHFAFPRYSEAWLNRSIYMSIATEITGGILCALISGLLMLLTNDLIKELALPFLLRALIHYGPGYPWKRCFYNNKHLACASVQETLGGVGQFRHS